MSGSTVGGGASGRPTNRLAREISPYLLLHKHNPVDWYPWGEEAFERARREDKPIFLSVGYATCYWCHVMERESFADAGTAAYMNEHFVNVKVDREERPEIDEIYMAATQIFTHQGGWPNSVFLTPQLEPFFAGTYFPPAEAHGRPSFRTVLLSMHTAWETRRDDIDEQAKELSTAMRRMLEERGTPTETVPPAAVAERSRDALVARFDAEHGGFGGAPKFPSPSNLFLLLDQADGTDTQLETTLDRMARGGLYDQLAGGFHRYATDREWKVPHFEKMLYDNGLLLEVYALDFARTGDPERARIVRETAAFLGRELTAPEGGLWSAIDAETGGREGGYHAWTLEDLVAVLGQEDASFLADLYGFDGDPFFEGAAHRRDSYVLHLPKPWAEQAARRRVTPEVLREQVEPLRAKLLEARERRERPLVDDKILADWNGTAIAGLAIGGDLLDEPELVDQAARAADFVLQHLRHDDGHLLHSWREGDARYDAYLADYVFLIHGLLALHDAAPREGADSWLAHAERLATEQIERLEDPVHGGFFTAGARDDVLFRSKEVFDGAMPAANGMAVLNFLALAEASDDPDRWRDAARRTLRAFGAYVESQPEGARTLALAAHRWHQLDGRFEGEAAEAAPPGVEGGLRVASLVEHAARAVVKPTLALDEADADGWRRFRLRLTIRDGWHVGAFRASHEATEDGATPDAEASPAGPTEASTLEVDGSLRHVEWPEAQDLWTPEVTQRVLQEAVEVIGEVRFAGEPVLRLRYQACDDRRCLVPVEIEVEPADAVYDHARPEGDPS